MFIDCIDVDSARPQHNGNIVEDTEVNRYVLAQYIN